MGVYDTCMSSFNLDRCILKLRQPIIPKGIISTQLEADYYKWYWKAISNTNIGVCLALRNVFVCFVPQYYEIQWEHHVYVRVIVIFHVK